MTRLAALLVLCLLAGRADATQDAWPALFDVAGVAADDVLNVRAAPDAGSPIVATLASGAVDIEVLRPNDRETWGLLNLRDGTGWVALSYLRRQPGQWSGAHPAVRRCFGTEPFWTLTMDEDGLARWSTPEIASLEGVVQTRWASENRRDRHGLSVRFGPTDESLPSEMVGFISTQECSDGMSDRRFGLSIDMLIGNMAGARMVSGCCSLAEGHATGEADRLR